MDSTSARVARLRDFFQHDPNNVDLACELADALTAQGALSDASQMLESLGAAARQRPAVQFREARLALMRGDFVRSERTYRTMLADDHDGVAVRHDLAFSQLCQRDAAAAYSTAQDAADRFGDSPALATLRARAALMLEDFDNARSNLAISLALAPQNSDALGVAALVHLDSADHAQAAALAAAALSLDSDQHEALIVAGTLALWEQRSEDACELFNRALARHPNSGRVLSGLGQALMLRNELEAGREALERAVVAMPDHIGTWHALAWSQLLLGGVDAAAESYRLAYELDRNFGDTHGGLALVAALRGDLDEAELHAKRALRLDPNAMTARYAQTLVLRARGGGEAADVAMDELLHASGIQPGLDAREFAERLQATLKHNSR